MTHGPKAGAVGALKENTRVVVALRSQGSPEIIALAFPQRSRRRGYTANAGAAPRRNPRRASRSARLASPRLARRCCTNGDLVPKADRLLRSSSRLQSRAPYRSL
jgi:hypothetical protein